MRFLLPEPTVDLCSNSNTSAPQSENRLTNVPLTVKCAENLLMVPNSQQMLPMETVRSVFIAI